MMNGSYKAGAFRDTSETDLSLTLNVSSKKCIESRADSRDER